MSLIKRILLNGTLLISSILLVLLILELYLRIVNYSGKIYEIDSNSGLIILKPNNTFIWKMDCLTNKVQTNSLGFHAQEEFKLNKENNEIRILVFGDSYVECLQVPYGKCFHKIIEEKINNRLKNLTNKRVKVYPFGISSNGRLMNLVYFEKYGKKYNPDLVIDLFISNDVKDDIEELRKMEDEYSYRYKPFIKLTEEQKLDWEFIENWLESNKIAKEGKLRRLLYQSKALHFVYHKVKRIKQNLQLARAKHTNEIPVSYQIFLRDYPELWKRAWEKEEIVIKTFNEATKQIGANYLLVLGTDGPCVHEDLKEKSILKDDQKFDCLRIEKVLREITKRHNINFLGLQSQFMDWAKRNPDKRTVFDCDGHWNEIGHQLAGELIANFLLTNSHLLEIN